MDDQALLVLAIFVATAALVLAFTSPLTGADRESRRRLRGRIEALSRQVVEEERVSLARQTYLERLTPAERKLEQQPALAPTIKLLQQAGIDLPAYRLVAFSLGAALLALLITPLFASSAALVLGIIITVAVLPFGWLAYRKRKRLEEFEAQLPDGLAMLARTLRAGLPLSQALQIISQEHPGPVGREFGIIFNEINYGGDLRTALMAMLERIPSISVMALSTAILIQRETGGNLAEAVDRLEKTIRERFHFQRHLKTLTAANMTSAKIVALLPLLMAMGMELISPGHLTPMLESAAGREVLWWTIGLVVVGFFWVRHMAKIKV